MLVANVDLTSPTPFLPTKINSEKDKRKSIAAGAYVGKNVNVDLPNSIASVNLLKAENGFIHFTSQYSAMTKETDASSGLVLRRGKEFNVRLGLSRPFSKDTDLVSFCFQWIDPRGKSFDFKRGAADIRTILLTFDNKFSETKEPKKWEMICNKISKDGEALYISIFPAQDAFVGMYKFSFDVSWKSSVSKYESPTPLFLIFNAWNSADPVYLKNPDERKVYLLEDDGLVFRGNLNSISSTVWKYSQFKDKVLMAVLRLGTLNKKIPYKSWDDPVLIANGYSSALESIMECKWPGNYKGGIPPGKWTGSAEIFDVWLSNDCKAVKYGQSPEIAGILTTIFRALGIPARTVTCYESAKHVDERCRANYFFSENELLQINQPSEGTPVWNFDSWSELWTLRNDLPAPYQMASWNAVSYNRGPSSVWAISKEDISLNYSNKEFYDELNADLYNWKVLPESSPVLISTVSNYFGKSVLAQSKSKDILDISSFYKIEKNPTIQTKNVENHQNGSFASKGFKFELKKILRINLGESFEPSVTVANESQNVLEVSIFLQVCSVINTNEVKKIIKTSQKKVKLRKGETHEEALDIPFKAYRSSVSEESFLRCLSFADFSQDSVSQYFIDYYTLCIVPPALKIVVTPTNPKSPKVISLSAHVSNPIDDKLEGEFVISELDSSSSVQIKTVVEPLGKASALFKLTPKSSGIYCVKVNFESPGIICSITARIKVK